MKYLFFLLLCTISCSYEPYAPTLTNTYSFEPGFTFHQENVIAEGLSIWSRDTGGRVTFTEVASGGNLTIVVGMEELAAATDAKINAPMVNGKVAKVIGLSIPNKGIIYLFVNRAQDDNLLKNTAAHEAGHQIGLHHIPMEELALMNPASTPVSIKDVRLSKYDINAFCDYWGCLDGNVSEALNK